MFEVVSRRVASVNAAAQARKDTLGASITALYDKIKRTKPRIVEQLVAASFRRARDLVSAMGVGLGLPPMLITRPPRPPRPGDGAAQA
jgi:hypothetical protein